ncbi:MAG: hypothetical protein ACI4F5_06260 [Acutalibacteraceae bacterium]
MGLIIEKRFSCTIVEQKQKTKGILQPFPIEYIDGFVSASGGFVNYNRYEVFGINDKTNRRNKKVFECFDESEAVDYAKKAGLTEPFEVVAVPHKPPTERQIEYALGLGITIPEGACMHDVSALISRVVDDDENVADRYTVANAVKKKIFLSRYSGRKIISEAIENQIIRNKQSKRNKIVIK